FPLSGGGKTNIHISRNTAVSFHISMHKYQRALGEGFAISWLVDQISSWFQ
ncbi:hypothetical protein KI387_006980, partial [Taxus chinensis]